MKRVLSIATLVAALAAPAAAWSQPWGGGMMDWGGGWGWGLFGMLHMFLWWVLIILGIVVLARWAFRGSKPDSAADRALAILRERYARGEIDKAEFEARKHDLAA